MQKCRIDLQKFCEMGGNRARPFYLDTTGTNAKDAYGFFIPRKLRAFVSNRWHNSYEAFREAADRAIATVIKGTNPLMVERGVTIGDAAELLDFPRYVFDYSAMFSEPDILLNVTIKDENEYLSSLFLAEAERRVAKAGKLKKGHTLERTQYPIYENGSRSVYDDAADMTEADGLNVKRLLSKDYNAEFEEWRERQIKSFMPLFMDA